MSILRKVLGPASKYDHRLPYTYAARVVVQGVPGMTESYVADEASSTNSGLGKIRRPTATTVSAAST